MRLGVAKGQLVCDTRANAPLVVKFEKMLRHEGLNYTSACVPEDATGEVEAFAGQDVVCTFRQAAAGEKSLALQGVVVALTAVSNMTQVSSEASILSP